MRVGLFFVPSLWRRGQITLDFFVQLCHNYLSSFSLQPNSPQARWGRGEEEMKEFIKFTFCEPRGWFFITVMILLCIVMSGCGKRIFENPVSEKKYNECTQELEDLRAQVEQYKPCDCAQVWETAIRISQDRAERSSKEEKELQEQLQQYDEKLKQQVKECECCDCTQAGLEAEDLDWKVCTDNMIRLRSVVESCLHRDLADSDKLECINAKTWALTKSYTNEAPSFSSEEESFEECMDKNPHKSSSHDWFWWNHTCRSNPGYWSLDQKSGGE